MIDIKLTEMEKAVLQLASLNYSDPELEKLDNTTCIDIDEVHIETGFTIPQIKGIFSSLSKKGLMYFDDENINGKNVVLNWLSEDGIDVVYLLKRLEVK